MANHSYFLKFSDSEERPMGIFGKSKDAKHPAWIEILSYAWAITRRGEEKEIQCATEDDAAATAIGRAATSGTLYPTVVVESTANGSVTAKTVLYDVYVSSFQMSNAQGRPTYLFSLNSRGLEAAPPAPSGPPLAPPWQPWPAPAPRGPGSVIVGRASSRSRHGRYD